jgi:endonuclease YncB( thermonuclease family)
MLKCYGVQMKDILFFLAVSYISLTIGYLAGFFPGRESEEILTVEVVSIYDGDTLKVNIPNFPPICGRGISIRIKGIDAPEVKSKDKKIRELALKAKKLVSKKLSNAKEIVLRNIERGKYFRIIADVFVDGKNLAEILLEKGLAKPYSHRVKQHSKRQR